MSRLVDVSHEVADGLVTYPGLPGPVICDFLSRQDSRSHYSEGTTFQIGRIEMVANTGTYVDSPFHRFEDGVDLAGLDVAQLADLDGILVDAREKGRALGADLFRGLPSTGKAVLVLTRWDKHWETPAYFDGHPYLTRDAAEVLLQHRPALVGIDSLNIDDTSDGSRPVHTLLLGAGVPIAEHLCNLAALPKSGFRFHAAPVKFAASAPFPFGRTA
jgi:arylformamidase